MPSRRPHLKDVEPIGVLAAERKRPDGRRKIKLRQAERKTIEKHRLIEAAVAMFLDLTTDHSWTEIAEELSISPQKLRDLTKATEFMELYDQMFAEIGHDPRYRASQAALADLLPKSIRELEDLVTRDGTPAGVRLRAIELVLKLNNLENKGTGAASESQELAKFLVEHHVIVDVPQEFANAAEKYKRPSDDVVDGEFVNGGGIEQALRLPDKAPVDV